MSETWRKKRYYKPRVILPTSDILDNPFPGRLVYLSGAETSLIRNLLAYAHRRVTFATTYADSYYLTPTTEEWDLLQELVANLEDTLMTDCCEELNETLQGIKTVLEAMGLSLVGLDDSLEEIDLKMGSMDTSLATVASEAGTANAHLEDVATAIDCICRRLEVSGLGTAVDPKWADNPDNFDTWTWGKEEPNPTITSQEELEACQLAQLWYQAGYELLSEVILPALRFGFDTVIPAAAALVAAWTGGLALPVAIGVYATAELIQELLELGYDSAESNLMNWLWTNKQDLVCPMFVALQAGGSASSMWAPIWAAVVESSEDISYGDKLLVRLFMGGLALSGAKVAFDAETTWAQTVPTEGYCDTCPDEPIVGSDWVAIPWPGPGGHMTLNHPPGSSWVGACWDYDIPDGFTCCGVFYEVSEYSGDCILKRVDGPDAGCGQDESFSPNTSDDLGDGHYYQRDEWNHDHDECVAAVQPGASQQTAFETHTGLHASQAFLIGWNCTGYAKVDITYLVFTGTTPP
jgi:hypothetical protein